MNLSRLFAGLAMVSIATGCAFFDEPVSDPGELIPSSVPANETLATPPIQGNEPSQVAPPPPPPPATPAVQPAPQSQPAPAAVPTPAPAPSTQMARSPSYLIVAPIENFPRDAQNIAVVHLTERNTQRELALCKALMDNMPTVDALDLPPNPLTVVVWPVPNDNAGANCLEMIADFDGIEVTPEAAKRINEDTAGPFLLTRNLPSSKRMIYDTSFIANRALGSTVNKWLSLLGSSPADWPEYRRAR